MFFLRSPFLTIRPRIIHDSNGLTVSTNRALQVFFCFSYRREVHVHVRTATIHVSERSWWFWRKKRVIRFREVEQVIYSFDEVWTSWDFRGRAHDTMEAFTVKIELKGTGEVVLVARFIGDGSAGDLGTWLLGDSLLDWEGSQAEDSMGFVELFCQMTGASLGKSLPQLADANGHFWACGSCGRKVAPRPKCLYCGGVASPQID